ncbi:MULTISPECIES: hypothetical protein [Stenotrophomonas]|jgi:hypothetical protein|uniref:Uncharacterized protein n=1 Tax=Stenotrophomonas maltophilia TaxID=40324 RepID=A0A4S2CVG8_STEMA|nr:MULTISPECIES: hypothetical protein [Stenotrophomonas]MBD3825977.1 hypothetical protein [Stenotrophomonas sp.]QIO87722.1 hypothetical protein G9274_001407 [Stenotrophomonas rhizophila]TGY32566.1 hypothetical protein E5352_15400 [Stenotrophomonas maltophilia]
MGVLDMMVALAVAGLSMPAGASGGERPTPRYEISVERLNVAAAAGKSAGDVLSDNNLKAQLESRLGDTDVVRAIVGDAALAEMVGASHVPTCAPDCDEHAVLTVRLILEDHSSLDFRLPVRRTTADALEDTARTASGARITPGAQ